MPPLQLIANQLQVNRGSRCIFRALTFKVAGGEALLLTGPNGAGKTTLIRTIAGYLSPADGTIVLEGGDVERDIAEQAHYVGHLNGIKASLTVIENLRFWAEYLSAESVSTSAPMPNEGGGGSVENALDHFNLLDLADIPAGYLSAGQKRRLGLARLLVAKRPLWLLDEPTVSLDRASVDLLAKAVEGHIAGGGIVIAATHIPLGLAKARELRLAGGTAVEAA